MAIPGKTLTFPSHLFEKSSGRGQSDILVTETEGDEYRSRLSHRRRVVSMTSASLTQYQHEEFQTFCDLVEDAFRPFLYIDLRRYRLTNEPLGVGDGVTKTFQLTRTRTLDGKSVTTPVHCPDHDYPPRFFPCAPGNTPVPYWPRPGDDGKLHVFADGVEVLLDVSTPTLLDALRYGGSVKLQEAPADDAVLTVSGCFYHLMRFEGSSPDTTPVGGGSWAISGTITLIEPKNIVRELSALREAT
jgi:hypothetical protein